MFKSAHAKNSNWETAVQSCVKQISGGKPDNFGFLYITEPLSSYLEQVLDAFRQLTGIEHWVGSVGMGICTNNQSNGGEYFDEPAIAIMTAQLPNESFALFSDTITNDSNGKVVEIAANNFPEGLPFILAHADSANPQILNLVEGLTNTRDAFVVGGLTSSQKNAHHVSGSVTGGGISGVVFSPHIEIVTSLSQGCLPIGKPHRIDKCNGNLITTLDGRRALDVLLEEAGITSSGDAQNIAGYIHAALPVTGSDTGDYLVRNLMGVDEGQGIVAIGAPVNDGDVVMFVRRDADAARHDLQNSISSLKKRAGNNIKGGIYISCIARGPNMFGNQNAEINLIRDIIGDIPIVGMFANGEISNSRLYTYTSVLNLFI